MNYTKLRLYNLTLPSKLGREFLPVIPIRYMPLQVFCTHRFRFITDKHICEISTVNISVKLVHQNVQILYWVFTVLVDVECSPFLFRWIRLCCNIQYIAIIHICKNTDDIPQSAHTKLILSCTNRPMSTDFFSLVFLASQTAHTCWHSNQTEDKSPAMRCSNVSVISWSIICTVTIYNAL